MYLTPLGIRILRLPPVYPVTVSLVSSAYSKCSGSSSISSSWGGVTSWVCVEVSAGPSVESPDGSSVVPSAPPSASFIGAPPGISSPAFFPSVEASPDFSVGSSAVSSAGFSSRSSFGSSLASSAGSSFGSSSGSSVGSSSGSSSGFSAGSSSGSSTGSSVVSSAGSSFGASIMPFFDSVVSSSIICPA